MSCSRWTERGAGAHRLSAAIAVQAKRQAGLFRFLAANTSGHGMIFPRLYIIIAIASHLFSISDLCLSTTSASLSTRHPFLFSPASYQGAVSAWSRECSEYPNLEVQRQEYCLQYDRPFLFYPFLVALSLSVLWPTWPVQHVIVHPMTLIYILSLCFVSFSIGLNLYRQYTWC